MCQYFLQKCEFYECVVLSVPIYQQNLIYNSWRTVDTTVDTDFMKVLTVMSTVDGKY